MYSLPTYTAVSTYLPFGLFVTANRRPSLLARADVELSTLYGASTRASERPLGSRVVFFVRIVVPSKSDLGVKRAAKPRPRPFVDTTDPRKSAMNSTGASCTNVLTVASPSHSIALAAHRRPVPVSVTSPSYMHPSAVSTSSRSNTVLSPFASILTTSGGFHIASACASSNSSAPAAPA